MTHLENIIFSVKMALKPTDACSSGDLQLGFGTNMNFQPASEMHSPPDSRKRTAQHDKGSARNEEMFVQPEPPKKHKGVHSTHVRSFEPNCSTEYIIKFRTD